MFYYLKPVGLGCEYLKVINLNLLHPSTIILGRNMNTGLDNDYPHVNSVSRSHVEIIVENGKIYLNALKVVVLNSKTCKKCTELKPGDVFSMLGAVKYYNYELNEGIYNDSQKQDLMGQQDRAVDLKCDARTVIK